MITLVTEPLIKSRFMRYLKSFNKNMHRKMPFFIGLFLLLIILIAASSLSGCKLGNLGLYNGDTDSSTNEITAASLPGPYSEEYFYEMKSKQLNTNPLADINIRKAVMHAIDRQRIIQELLGSYGRVLNSIFHPASDYFDPAWVEYDYDLDKAAEYLEMAGYSKDNPLFLTIGANEESYARNTIAEIIKEDLDKIGIKVWVTTRTSREWYLDHVKNGDYELGIWSLYTPDCKSVENYFSSIKIPTHETDTNRNCNNYYWYEDEKVDLLINKFINETSIEKKSEYSEQIQKELADDAIIMPLFNRIFVTAYNNKIQNLEISRSDGSFFKNIQNMDITGEPTPIDIETEEDSAEVSTEKANLDEADTIFKSMVVGYEQEPYVLNPLISDSIYRDFITSLIIEGLWKKGMDGNYEPVLVESVISGDGNANNRDDLVYSLKASIRLKDNIFWEDCTPITANDVVETINAILEDETLDYSNINYQIIKSIELVDEKEFTVTFNEYDCDWKECFSIIFPEEKLKYNSASKIFSENIFGSGQYKLNKWVKGEYIILEKNICYHGEKPEIDAIKFIFNSDINFLIELLKDGSIDVLSIPADLELIQEINEDENLDFALEQGNLWEHLAFCLKPKQSSN